MISCSLLRASVAAVALFGAVSPGWAQLLNQEGLRAAAASVTSNPPIRRLARPPRQS